MLLSLMIRVSNVGQYSVTVVGSCLKPPSLQSDLSARDLINKGLVWGEGRVRAMCVRLCVCACMTPARPLTKSNCSGGLGGGQGGVFCFCRLTTMSVCLSSVPTCVRVSSPLSSSHRCARQSLILHKISAHQAPPHPPGPPLALPAFLCHPSSLDR